MSKLFEKFLEGLSEFSIKLVVSILIIIIGFRIIKYFVDFIKRGKGFNKLEKSSQTFIASILTVTLKALVIISAVTNIGVPMSSIIAIIGSVGLALGLALQGGLSNIAGGVMIMLFKPFKVGDYIEVDNICGTVKEINIFHTILDTIDDRIVTIPNGGLSNSVVVNYSSMKSRKLDLRFSASYNSSIDKVKKILKEVALNSKYLIKNREKDIYIVLSEHSDSALVFTFRMPVNTADYWEAKYEVLEEVKKAFDKEKIEIPYPQLDVHLDK